MQPTTFWVLAAIALAIGEGLTVGLTFIWFAVGALGALLIAFLGGPLWLQLVAFLLLSAVALALVRPVAGQFFQPKRSPTNADRVIGKTGQVIQEINNAAGQGQAVVLGQTWSARSQMDVVIPVGASVKVLRIEGVKVFVETV